MHPLDQQLDRFVSGHEQPLGRAATDLGSGGALLVADDAPGFGFVCKVEPGKDDR